MLLKASDFIVHDISPDLVFEHCEKYLDAPLQRYDLELVLRKWYHVDPGREFRCFVRGQRLIGKFLASERAKVTTSSVGVSQRDDNHYGHMQDPETRSKITNAVLDLWTREIRNEWPTKDCVSVLAYLMSLLTFHLSRCIRRSADPKSFWGSCHRF